MTAKGIDISGSGNVVVGGNLISHGPEPATPTPGHGRRCPQCERQAWAATQHCMHCGLDLFAHDAFRHYSLVIKRLYWVMGLIALLGVVCFWGVSPLLHKLGYDTAAFVMQGALPVCLLFERSLLHLLGEQRQMRAML